MQVYFKNYVFIRTNALSLLYFYSYVVMEKDLINSIGIGRNAPVLITETPEFSRPILGTLIAQAHAVNRLTRAEDNTQYFCLFTVYYVEST